MEKPNEKTNGISDLVIKSLKKEYFDLVAKENYPKTPEITAEADEVEAAIKEILESQKER